MICKLPKINIEIDLSAKINNSNNEILFIDSFKMISSNAYSFYKYINTFIDEKNSQIFIIFTWNKSIFIMPTLYLFYF